MSEQSPEEREDATRGIVVLIPAYNEERYIGSVVLKARRYAEAVIVVDDGSTDATAEIAEAAGAVVVRHAENRGKGAALNSGFRRARGLDPQALVVLDADGQHRPEEMGQVLSPILSGEADIVVGSRYLDRRSIVPRHRIWGHRVFTGLTQLMSPKGPIPVQCVIEGAKDLNDALDKLPAAIDKTVKAMIEEAKEGQRQEDSRIVVPGREE